MSDGAPILFEVVLGNLRPANEAARELLRTLGKGSRVTVDVKKATANKRRLDFYWTMLGVAAENLDERVPGLTAPILHKIVKQKLELGEWIQLPSGDRVFNERSIAFAKMSEPERAEFINRVDALLSRWLGCEPGQVIDAARTREAA